MTAPHVKSAPPSLLREGPAVLFPKTVLSTLLAALALAAVPQTVDDDPILGFTPESSAVHRELEARFDEEMDPDNLREWMEYMVSKQPMS